MTLNFQKARRLCTERELALVSAARGPQIKTLSPKQLDGKIVRARKLRDKSRDIARRRPHGTRTDTIEKAEIFAEVLRRFEARAAKLKHEGVLTQRRTALRKRTSRVSKRAEAAAMARKQRKLARAHIPRAHAHTSGANRRQQARADSRR